MESSNLHIERLNKYTLDIIKSQHPKKIIMAGPGTGKTTSFLKLLESRQFNPQNCLVFTFLKTLREDLKQKLETMANVFTFHGYCFNLLYRFRSLRAGLNDNFDVFPALLEIIEEDWKIINRLKAPDFKKDFHYSIKSVAVDFFLGRGNYYNAIGFDDSVFRVYLSLKRGGKIGISYSLILVDEAQDFNRLEIDFILLMAEMGPILIVGDDDQALYYFRHADPSYVIKIWNDPKFEKQYLPYCMRCTKVIVDAFDDVVNVSIGKKLLSGRVPKKFEYYPPLKEADSKQYPKIEIVKTSVHSKKLNYFGEYIEKEIRKIPSQDITKSSEEGVPTALIISLNPFRVQVEDYLEKAGFKVITSEKDDIIFPERKEVLQGLRKKPDSNLWWRAILHIDNPPFLKGAIKKSKEGLPLKEILPEDYTKKILSEISDLKSVDEPEESVSAQPVESNVEPTVKVTTYEGAKGLSAYHTFIVGLQTGILPKSPQKINDTEIRKFLVAITRTKKHCHLLYTQRQFGIEVKPSVFIDWIKPDRKTEEIYVDKKYLENLVGKAK